MSTQKSAKISAGAKICVKPGVSIPECPEVDASGWSGMVVEAKGKGADCKYIVEWDDQTVEKIPESYKEACEKSGLYFMMACFPACDVEAL